MSIASFILDARRVLNSNMMASREIFFCSLSCLISAFLETIEGFSLPPSMGSGINSRSFSLRTSSGGLPRSGAEYP